MDRIKINFCKQLFSFRESELSNTFCKLHVLTYFTSVSFSFAAITQSSQEPAPGHRLCLLKSAAKCRGCGSMSWVKKIIEKIKTK